MSFLGSLVQELTVSLACSAQEELETLLEESGHLRTLAFLYAKKGMSSKALSIWRVLSRSYSSGLLQDTAEAYNLDDPSSLPISSTETSAIEASKILEQSDDSELVLQHLGWVCD